MFTAFTADLDSRPGQETVSIASGVATISSSNSGARQAYPIGAWDAYFVRDLDGIPGDELAFVDYSLTQTKVTAITHESRNTLVYNFGPATNFQFSDLDGVKGAEVLFTNTRVLNGSPQEAIGSVLNHSSRTVQTFNIGRALHTQVLDLDGRGGNEVLFTNIRTVNGVPQPSTALVLTYAQREIRSYDVGSPNFLQIADLDGLNGSEVLFTNLRGVSGAPGDATATVLNHSMRSVQSFAVGKPLNMQIVDLDSLGGNEVLFTNVRTVNGIPQPSTAFVLTYAQRETRSYDVGSPNFLQIADLDGLNGPEVLFTNLRSVNGSPSDATATVLNHSMRSVQSFAVGKPLNMQIVDLDGRRGNEVLFTNVRTINGIPQPSTAFVLTNAQREVRSYDVGSPNFLQIADLDGVNGPEVLFTNLRTVNGSPIDATATVLNHSARAVHSFRVGQPLRMQIVDLDGVAGDELIFSSNARRVVLNYRSRSVV